MLLVLLSAFLAQFLLLAFDIRRGGGRGVEMGLENHFQFFFFTIFLTVIGKAEKLLGLLRIENYQVKMAPSTKCRTLYMQPAEE